MKKRIRHLFFRQGRERKLARVTIIPSLTADEKHRIYETLCRYRTPAIKSRSFTLPPVWEWYYKQYHPEYKPLPPFKPGCGEDFFQPMQFIYPSPNARIKLTRQMDGSGGFTARGAGATATPSNCLLAFGRIMKPRRRIFLHRWLRRAKHSLT